MHNESVIASFCSEMSPMVSCLFHYKCYDILSFPYPYVGVIFDKSFLSRSHKLADADPTGTLDSWLRGGGEQKTHTEYCYWGRNQNIMYVSLQYHHMQTPGQRIFLSCLIHFLCPGSTDYLSLLLPIDKCYQQLIPLFSPIATYPWLLTYCYHYFYILVFPYTWGRTQSLFFHQLKFQMLVISKESCG